MSGISASRERTDVLRTIWMGPEEGEREKTVIRCNRMNLPLRNRQGEQRVAVRGKTLTGTMHMAVCLLDSFRTKGTITEDYAIRDWCYEWVEQLSEYERNFTHDNWVAVYCNGTKVYSNALSPEIDAVEEVSRCGPVSDEMLARNLERFRREEDEQVYVKHDTQLAVVLNNHERFVKCSILERGLTTDGTFSFALYRRRKGRGTMIEALDIATNIVEANSMRTQYNIHKDRLAKIPLEDKEMHRKVREQQNAAADQIRALSRAITVAQENNQMQFWPDEPRFSLT